jgi:predicted DsbA family dithiol-disulfide isomerase
MMKVEIWSDFLCPFCYIGKRQFEQGLAQFAHQDEVEIEFKSFELDPNAPYEPEGDMHELLASKYSMSIEKAKAINADLTEKAAAVGLTYHFDTMIPTNSFDAHRLTHFAGTLGLREKMSERLFRAYFTDSKHIGDKKVLLELAIEVGLPEDATAALLAGEAFSAEVRAEEQEGSRLGIQGVPFFVINRKYGVSGAQSSDVFADVLAKAWEESQ